MRTILINYIIRNKKNFIIIISLFCIGVGMGIFLINNLNDIQQNEVSIYIEEVIKTIKGTDSFDKMKLLFFSIKENVFSILIIWFLGCTIIGGIFIYVAMIYKGFFLGYTIAAMMAVLGIKQGIFISLISILFQNIFFLPAYFLMAENRNKII